MRSVSLKIKGYVTFKVLLQIKYLERSIEELQKVQEENDKMRKEEKTMSAEEISKRWRRLRWEMILIFKKGVPPRDLIFNSTSEIRILYLNILKRLKAVALNIPKSSGPCYKG